jgi:hypothetical protein
MLTNSFRPEVPHDRPVPNDGSGSGQRERITKSVAAATFSRVHSRPKRRTPNDMRSVWDTALGPPDLERAAGRSVTLGLC